MEFTYPGVYRSQAKTKAKQARGISPSNHAVVGFSRKGPVGQAVFATSPKEVRDIFGKETPKSLAPTCVSHYYDNDGENIVFVRTVGPGAEQAEGWLDREVTNASLPIGSGSSHTLDQTLTDEGSPASPARLVPGSVEAYFADLEDVSAYDPGIATEAGVLTYDFTLSPFILQSPTGLSIAVSDSVPSLQETFTDNGDGTLTGDGGGTGTVDYHTGEVSITLNADPGAGGSVAVDYSYHPATHVTEEVVADAVVGAEIYHVALANKMVVEDSLELTWTDKDGAAKSAAWDSGAGAFTGDATSGGFDTATGKFWLDVGANTLLSGTELEAEYSVHTLRKAVDDGNGVLANDATWPALAADGTIDYETGEVTGTTNTMTKAGVMVYLEYKYKTHLTRAKNPGVSGDDLRLVVAGNPNHFNVTTSKYDRYNVFVEEKGEDGNYSLVDRFFGVVLDDVSDNNHISKVVNDPYAGSDLLEIVSPYSEFHSDDLRSSKFFNQELFEGDGATRRQSISLLDIEDSEIIPGTVEITYTAGGVTYEIADDKVGGLTGSVDASATNTIDYDTGVIKLTPELTPDSATFVEAGYTLESATDQEAKALSGGKDGNALTRDDVTHSDLKDTKKGMFALEDVPEMMLMLSIPDFAGDPVAELRMLDYAGERKNMTVFVTPPEGSTVRDAIRYKRRVLGSQSDRGAMYWPWIQVDDPVTGNVITVPPNGHVSGVYARTDRERSVAKTPAGTATGGLKNLRGFEVELGYKEVGQLFQAGINPVWEHPTKGKLVWGGRTLYPVDGEDDQKLSQVAQRRTVDFTDVVIADNLWWVVFENNDPSLRTRVRNQTQQILRQLYKARLFKGDTEDEAFVVIVDKSNNSDADVSNGIFTLDWGVAVKDVAEFVESRHSILQQ